MTTRTRGLSYRQAQTCEQAAKPRCRCRCGGAMHGAKRGDVRALDLEDPHCPKRTCRVCRGLE